MRKSGIAAIMALGILSHGTLSYFFSPPPFMTTAVASPLVLAQAAPPSRAVAPPAPAQPAAAVNAPQSPSTVVAPAEKSALSIPACSVKYLEAKVTGKLQGRKWVDFRRDECGRREVTAVFPTAIAPKYASDKDIEKARTKTCADQFTANKSTNANGGLVWVEKDGGYYAECVIRLKG
jgi:hypothetical protein